MGKTARTLIVLMRISPVEKAVWTKAAKAAGMKLGPWLLKPRRDELNAPKGE